MAALFQRDTAVFVEGMADVCPRPALSAAPATQAAADSARAKRLGRAGDRLAARMTWAFFVGLGLLGALAACAISVVMVRVARRRGGGGPGLGRGLALVFAPAAAFAAAMAADPLGHMNVMYPVLTATVARDCALGMRTVADVMNVVNSVDMGAAVAMVLACVLLVDPGTRRRRAGPARSARALARRLAPVLDRMRVLRLFLYVATGTLVVGVLRTQAVMEMALSFIPPLDAAALGRLATVVPSAMGVFYTLVLAAVYLPAAYVLRNRAAAELEWASVDPDAREALRDEAGLTRSLGEAVARTIAILAPLLAGPFAALVQGL